jgi:hypothetical protein
MATVSGTLKVGEANGTRAAIRNRTVGYEPSWMFVMILFVIGGMVLGYTALRSDPMLGGLGGGFGGMLAYYPASQWWMTRIYRARLKKNGTSFERPFVVELAREALSYEHGDVRHIAKWQCVSDLFFSSGYWIFLAQSYPCLIPKRSFADHAAEQAFVADALSHMTDAARARSPQAIKFAEKGTL